MLKIDTLFHNNCLLMQHLLFIRNNHEIKSSQPPPLTLAKLLQDAPARLVSTPLIVSCKRPSSSDADALARLHQTKGYIVIATLS